jgi:hypothetical protein
MKATMVALLLSICLVALSARPQTVSFEAKHPPRFEDFPVAEKWDQLPSPVRLRNPSEKVVQTELESGAMEPPNFAGHYRFTIFRCGSECAAGAVINLKTGEVFQAPLATKNGNGWERWIISTGMFDGAAIEFRVESRLVIVFCGRNYSERLQKNVPDAYYFVWEGNRFRQLPHVSGKQAAR